MIATVLMFLSLCEQIYSPRLAMSRKQARLKMAVSPGPGNF